MKVGYARVSTEDQNLHMQEDALKSSGCEEIFTDIASGAKSQRPGLDRALNYVREGDTIRSTRPFDPASNSNNYCATRT